MKDRGGVEPGTNFQGRKEGRKGERKEEEGKERKKEKEGSGLLRARWSVARALFTHRERRSGWQVSGRDSGRRFRFHFHVLDPRAVRAASRMPLLLLLLLSVWLLSATSGEDGAAFIGADRYAN